MNRPSPTIIKQYDIVFNIQTFYNTYYKAINLILKADHKILIRVKNPICTVELEQFECDTTHYVTFTDRAVVKTNLLIGLNTANTDIPF
jgi:hypothetical protein